MVSENSKPRIKRTLVQNLLNYNNMASTGFFENNGHSAFYHIKDGTMYMLPNIVLHDIDEYNFANTEITQAFESKNENGERYVAACYSYELKGNNHLLFVELTGEGQNDSLSELEIAEKYLVLKVREKEQRIKTSLLKLDGDKDAAEWLPSLGSWGYVSKEDMFPTYLRDYLNAAS